MAIAALPVPFVVAKEKGPIAAVVETGQHHRGACHETNRVNHPLMKRLAPIVQVVPFRRWAPAAECGFLHFPRQRSAPDGITRFWLCLQHRGFVNEAILGEASHA